MGCQVKENFEASVEPADLTSIVQRLKSTIGFFVNKKKLKRRVNRGKKEIQGKSSGFEPRL